MSSPSYNRSNTEEFVEKATAVHAGKYDYSLTEYNKALSKVRIICPKHGAFLQRPSSHLNGNGCKECAKLVVGDAKRSNLNNFILKAKAVHGNRYSYDLVMYKTSKTAVKIVCQDHGVFTQKPNDHLQRRGCPTCAIKNSADARRCTKTDFINKARAVHGDRYDYSKVEYVDAMGKVSILCKEHGIFLQSPSQHLSYGCKKCGIEKISLILRDTKELFVQKALVVHGSAYDYSLVDYVDSQTKVCIVCPTHGPYYVKPYSHLNGRTCKACSIVGPSRGEVGMSTFIASLVEVKLSDRKALAPFEIDCLIPSKKLGVEFCGTYFHSTKYRPSDYHLKKLSAASSAGYGLVQVFDDEWIEKSSIVKSILANRLGFSERKVFARNTHVEPVSLVDSRVFLDANHLQGDAQAQHRYGLYVNGELVMLATFSSRRRVLGKMLDGWYELVRLCPKLNTSVIGGFSKLLKYFINAHSPEGIKTFCDRRYFTGAGYEAVGFSLSHYSAPNYFYVKNEKRYSRYMFQKHKLASKLTNYSAAMSEKENMAANGYNRIYDCGNLVFTLDLSTPKRK